MWLHLHILHTLIEFRKQLGNSTEKERGIKKKILKLVGVQPNFTASWLSGAAYGCRLCDGPGISLYISAVCHNTCPIAGMFINCLHVKDFLFFLHTIWLGSLLACNTGKESQRTTKRINDIQTICLANHTLTPDSRVIYMHSTDTGGGGGGGSGGIAKLANHISHQTALSQARLHLMDIKMSLPLKGGQPRLRFGCVRRKAGKGLQQVITSCKPYARTICLTHNTYTHLKMGYLAGKTQLSIKAYDN